MLDGPHSPQLNRWAVKTSQQGKKWIERSVKNINIQKLNRWAVKTSQTREKWIERSGKNTNIEKSIKGGYI
jgi:hypothetical protein